MSKSAKSKTWYPEAAERMVREFKNLRTVAVELEVNATGSELEYIEKSSAFQDALWKARHKYHKELGSDPLRSKEGITGQLLIIAQKLMEEGEWAKASEVLFKIAKIDGQVGAEQINVFAGLSTRDIEKLEKEIKGIGSERSSTGSSEPTRLN